MKNFITYFLIITFTALTPAIGFYISQSDIDNSNIWIFSIIAVVLSACSTTYITYSTNQSLNEAQNTITKLNHSIESLRDLYFRPENAKELITDLLNIIVRDLTPSHSECRACIFRHNSEDNTLYMWANSNNMPIEEQRLIFRNSEGLVGHIYWHERENDKDFIQVDMTEIDLRLTFKLSEDQIAKTEHIKLMMGIPIILEKETVILIIDSTNVSDASTLLNSTFQILVKGFIGLIRRILATQHN